MEQVDKYIHDHPENQQIIFLQLREIILNSSPKIVEKFSYQCPFYFYKKPLCYLYTSKKKSDKILLGFCQGAELSNERGLLTATNRKQIRLIEMDVNDKLNLHIIREIINEAILLQDVMF